MVCVSTVHAFILSSEGKAFVRITFLFLKTGVLNQDYYFYRLVRAPSVPYNYTQLYLRLVCTTCTEITHASIKVEARKVVENVFTENSRFCPRVSYKPDLSDSGLIAPAQTIDVCIPPKEENNDEGISTYVVVDLETPIGL